MKRRDFLKRIGVGTAVLAVGGADLALFADNGSIGTFDGTIVLGRPTNSSITINVLSNGGLEAYFQYGTQPGVYTDQTATSAIKAGVPFEDVIANLQSDTRYYYRMRFRQPGGDKFKKGREYTFHMQRSAGTPFTFVVQADSHLDEQSIPKLYEITLSNELSDMPDFVIDLGDTCMSDKFGPKSYEAIDRYRRGCIRQRLCQR